MLPFLRDRGPEVWTDVDALRGDGWRVYGVSGNALEHGPALLHDLAAGSGGPVLAASFADSDYRWLVGVSPSGDEWGVAGSEDGVRLRA